MMAFKLYPRKFFYGSGININKMIKFRRILTGMQYKDKQLQLELFYDL